MTRPSVLARKHDPIAQWPRNRSLCSQSKCSRLDLAMQLLRVLPSLNLPASSDEFVLAHFVKKWSLNVNSGGIIIITIKVFIMQYYKEC